MSSIEEANKEKALANDAFQKKNYEEALKHYNQACTLNSADHVHFSNRSACYASMEEYEKALEDAEKCIQIKPDWAKGYSRKGLAEFNLGKYDEAESTYQKGLEFDANNAQLKEGLAAVKKEREAPPFDFNNLGSQFPGFNAFPGGAGGGANDMYTQMMMKLIMNPETLPYLQDPEFMKKLQELKKDPSKLPLYMNDPKMKKAFEVIQQDMPSL